MPIVKVGRSTAHYFITDRDHVPTSGLKLANYRQGNVHTCGFVAALTVAHYFDPNVPARDILTAVRPSLNYGVSRYKLIEGLEKLGIDTDYRDDLTVDKLRKYAKRGVPVIVSVWPEEWLNDHWTVVWGFSDTFIHLTNHGCLTLDQFYEEWSDFDMRTERGASGEGIVCTKS